MFSDEQQRFIGRQLEQNRPVGKIVDMLNEQYEDCSGMDMNNFQYRLRQSDLKIAKRLVKMVPMQITSDAEPIAA